MLILITALDTLTNIEAMMMGVSSWAVDHVAEKHVLSYIQVYFK